MLAVKIILASLSLLIAGAVFAQLRAGSYDDDKHSRR